MIRVAALFLVSGATGLLYEVLWARQLARVLGGAYPAQAVTVAVFLGGLALGAAVAGRRARRVARPLRAYGLLEAGIGVYAALFPLLLAGLHPAFGWCYRSFGGEPLLHGAARLLLVALLLLPPAAAMGATLPLLLRAAVGGGATVLGGTGLLYGINTAGAAAGAFLAGFVLLPALGFTGSMAVGVAANLAVAAAALLLDRGRAPLPPPLEEPAPAPARTRSVFLLVALGSGAASMLCQLAWTRALVLGFGSSVHAFALVLTLFVLGLGIGGLLAPALRGAKPAVALLLLEAAVGLAAWASVGTLAGLPLEVIARVSAGFAGYGDLVAWQAGRALLVVLPATLALGAAFPVLVSLAAPGDDGGASRAAGRVVAWNTAGVLLGALAGGLLLLPAAGTRAALLVAAGIHLALAALLAAATLGPRRGIPAAAAVAAAGAVLLPLAPGWPPHRFQSGPYLYAAYYAATAEGTDRPVDRVLRDNAWDLPYLREGRSVSVAVNRRLEGGLTLRVNGKADASSETDMDTQLLIAHLPLLARPGASRVLVVGLASGVSAGAAAAHGPASLDIVEIAPEVAGAEPLFRPWNGDVTRRPGVRVILEDGRAHLEHGAGTYDAVVSEPTNPWIAGVSDLFTREYFLACRAALSPGGTVSVWLQSYGMALEDFRLVVRTFRSVFPDATVWEAMPGGDYLLLGTADGPLDAAAAIAAAPWPTGDLAAALARAGLGSKEEALAALLLDRAATEAFAAGGPSRDLHTDDRLQLEFRAPRTIFAPGGAGLVSTAALDAAAGAGSREPPAGADPARLGAARAAREKCRRGLLRRGPASEALLEEGLAAGCTAPWARNALARLLGDRGRRRLAGGEWAGAEADLLRARALRPTDATLPASLGMLRLRRTAGAATREDLDASLALLDEALALHPRSEGARCDRAIVLQAMGRAAEAEAEVRALLGIRPDSVRGLGVLAFLRVAAGDRDGARSLVEAGLALEPADAALLGLKAKLGGAVR